MGSRREVYQKINTIPSKSGRIDAGIKLGLFPPEDFLPITVSSIEKSPLKIPTEFIQKIKSAMDNHPIIETLKVTPEQIRLPPEIKDLSNLPEDFLVLLESNYASKIVEGVQKRINSPGFKISLLHRIAQESFTVGLHNIEIHALQQIAEWQINKIQDRSAKQTERLQKEINKKMAFVLNGERMLAEEAAREEQTQRSITGFHDGAAKVNGLIGRGLGEITCYTMKIGGEIIWVTAYWSAKILKLAALSAVQEVHNKLNHRTINRKQI